MATATEEFDSDNSIIREDLVETAVKFLENPKVASTPLSQKQNFLRKKGLHDQEIKLACERSGAYGLHEQQTRTQIIPPQTPQMGSHLYPITPYGHSQLSLFHRLREMVHSFAIFSFVAYIIYKFYEKFIAPFLFGKKKKSIEESLEELDKSVKASVEELQNSLTDVKVEVDKINKGSSTYHQLHELKSDVASVKGLLLSRKQFPAVSSNSPVVPPSIPAWQMSSAAAGGECDPDGKTEELMEVGSGSGSSEPEHCTHKSDSSLEIIYSKESDSESYHRKSYDEIDKD